MCRNYQIDIVHLLILSPGLDFLSIQLQCCRQQQFSGVSAVTVIKVVPSCSCINEITLTCHQVLKYWNELIPVSALENVQLMVLSLYLLFFFLLSLNPYLFSPWSFASLSYFQWATVTFHLPHHVLKLVANAIVNELKKINQNVAALSVASSIMDRLSYLLSNARPELGVGPGRSVDRWASRETNDDEQMMIKWWWLNS